MFVDEKEFFQISLITILSLSVYSKYLPRNHLLEFLFYCFPQVLIIRYPNWANFIYVLFLFILFVKQRKIIKAQDSKPDLIDRSRMRIIFLVCTVFLLSNFRSPSIKVEENKINLSSLVMNSYVFNAGLVSCKASFSRKIMHMTKSFILGVIHLLGELKIKNQTEIEYINTYFLLSILNLISILGLPKYSFLIGLGLLTGYQISLIFGFENILRNGYKQYQFINNFRKLALAIPLYSIYLMSSNLGYSLIVHTNKRKYTIQLLLISLFFLSIFKWVTVTSSEFYNAPFCLLIFFINSLDIFLFELCFNFYQMSELKITQFASRIVFHAFTTLNIFIPLAKSERFFESQSEIEILSKTIGYLFVIFYCCFKFKCSIFDIYLKSRLEKIKIFKKILNFQIEDRKIKIENYEQNILYP